MAYGVIIYEDEHDNFLTLSDEDAGRLIKNMIRTFKGEEVVSFGGIIDCYSSSLCKRVEKDKAKADRGKENGLKGGAPVGNTNAKKTTENNPKTTEKQPKNNLKTTEKQPKTNNNYNYNNNYNKNNNNNSNKNLNKNNNKLSYGTFENVYLTDEEYMKLKDKFPDYQNRIDTLSEYLKSKGDKYKDHYATILSWARRDDNKVTQLNPVLDRLKVVDGFK